MRLSWRNAGGVAVVAAAAGGGFLVSRLLLEREPPKASTPVAETAAVESLPAEYTPPSIPERIPNLTLTGLDGAPHALSEWRGRPLLINFWATWCEPCRREIPLLKDLRAAHASEGLEILGVALDFRDAVAAYAREAGIGYPVLIAEEDGLAPRAFGVGMALPSTVFADREGRIVGVKVGELKAEEANRLIRQIIHPDLRTSPQKVP